MRIQETNQILKEAKIQRHDVEKHDRVQAGGFSRRVGEIAKQLGTLLRRPEARAGLSALGVALLAGAGAALRNERNRRSSWFHLR